MYLEHYSDEGWPHDVDNEASSVQHLPMQEKTRVYVVHVKLKDLKVLASSSDNTCI